MRAVAAPAVSTASEGAGRRESDALAWAVLGVAVLSAAFSIRQNAGPRIGGPISVPKILWLNYALTAWVAVPAALACHPALDTALRRLFAWFFASMVVRGAVELPLLYVIGGWDPLYGIAHDVFNVGLVAVCRRRAGRPRATLADPFRGHAWRFTWSLQLGMAAEIVFATLFRALGVHRDAVYFAAPTATFRHINLLTGWIDVVAYADLLWLLVQERRGRVGRPVRPAPGEAP